MYAAKLVAPFFLFVFFLLWVSGNYYYVRALGGWVSG